MRRETADKELNRVEDATSIIYDREWQSSALDPMPEEEGLAQTSHGQITASNPRPGPLLSSLLPSHDRNNSMFDRNDRKRAGDRGSEVAEILPSPKNDFPISYDEKRTA